MDRIISFLPIADKNSKILILGTMPGKDSLKIEQYYANSRNSFWKIMFELFKTTFSYDYKTRTELLLNNKVAIWDTLKSCVREGSADVDILASEPNDLAGFVKDHPSIQTVFCNGKDAALYFSIYYKGHAINNLYLPSTSAANAIGWERKLNEWSVILKYLN
jgi:hypoxanthine-DNA glycosylase